MIDPRIASAYVARQQAERRARHVDIAADPNGVTWWQVIGEAVFAAAVLILIFWS